MRCAFYGCESLVKLNKIPDNVTNINFICTYCKSLEKTPILSYKLEEMNCAFRFCYSLKHTTEIPNSVKDMSYTFEFCNSLETALNIPESAIYIDGLFSGCNSLKGVLEINGDKESINKYLIDAATNDNCELILTGSSKMIKDIFKTKSYNSNIKLKNNTK